MLPKIILVSLITTIVCFFMRNDLAQLPAPLPELAHEPEQQTTYKAPFDVSTDVRQYQITPLFDYDLYGLVVSYREHDARFGMHKKAGDDLNVADFCVVWGDNALALDLTEFEFSNGQFTCYTSTKSRAAWQQFNIAQLSNNHLITEDPYLRELIQQAEIGDQIHIQGMLASYGHAHGTLRSSSITRTDTGNHACETIYVTNFEILERYTSPWRWGLYASLLIFLVSTVWYFATPYRAKY